MTSISKTKLCRANLLAFDPKGSKNSTTLSANWLVTKFSLEAVQRLEAAQWQIRGKTGINFRGKKLSVPRLEICL